MIIIKTAFMRPQQYESTCYQDVLEAIYNCYFDGPRKPLPGFWETELMKLGQSARLTAHYDAVAFNWAFAAAGEESSQQAIVNEFFKKNNWALGFEVKKLIKKGKKLVKAYSEDDHLGLIRFFNREFSPIQYDVRNSPAEMEMALREFGPLFAAGLFASNNQYHVVMVVSIDFDLNSREYKVGYLDGLKRGRQVMSYSAFCERLTNDSSAILHFNHQKEDFVIRGDRESGTIYRFKLLHPNNKNYVFKQENSLLTDLVELPAQQKIILDTDDHSWLSPEAGYVYAALPLRFSFSDLDRLSFTLCRDPHQALRFLEENCTVDKPVNSLSRKRNFSLAFFDEENSFNHQDEIETKKIKLVSLS